jgi:hypothetical protein
MGVGVRKCRFRAEAASIVCKLYLHLHFTKRIEILLSFRMLGTRESDKSFVLSNSIFYPTEKLMLRQEHIHTHTRGIIPTEILPYTVGVVRTDEQLRAVCKVRQLAYGHHFPHIGEMLTSPEAVDWDNGVAIFYVQSKLTGEFVGTGRVQTNLFSQLVIEGEVTLPSYISSTVCAESSRLAVLPTYQHKFRSIFRILSKTIYLYCLAKTVRYLVLGARTEGLVRAYEAIGCKDIDPEKKWTVLIEGGGLPHRILFLDTFRAEANWGVEGLKNYDFFWNTYHPDLNIFGSLAGSWTQPRNDVMKPIDLRSLQMPLPEHSFERRNSTA